MQPWNNLIARNFDTATRLRGQGYWQQGRVLSVAWENRHHDNAILHASVSGSTGQYQQVIRVDFAGEKIAGSCSCPVGHNCKHVVAAFIKAMSETAPEEVPAAAASTAPQPPRPAARSKTSTTASTATALPHPIEAWLAKLAAAESSSGDCYPADVAERILYVIEPSRDQVDLGGGLRVVKARANKSGEYAGVSNYNNTHSYFNPPRYMLQSDTDILRQLSALTGRGYSFQFPLVNVSATLMRSIIATGRAYWLDVNRPRLHWGLPRTGVIEWHTLENGDRQPTLATLPTAVTLATSPPVYVDSENDQCGIIESTLSPAIAVAVAAAPILPARWIARVSQELQSRHLHQSIPPPTMLVEKLLTDYRPQPVLLLKSHQKRHYDTRTWKHVVTHVEAASLSFEYLGLRVAGKTPPEITRVDGNQLLRVTRDGANAAFERAARARLTGAGMVAADKILLRGVSRQMQGALIFAEATSDERAFDLWTAFLENTVPQLRIDGWKIEIAGDFRFDLVPVSGWYAEVDESSNRWFDLDIGIDVGGARVSLIPILVRLIQTSPVDWGPAALEARNNDAKVMVPIGNGQRAALPLARLKPLLATLYELYLREPSSGRVRLSLLDAARLAELDRSLDLRWLGGDRMRRLGARLARFDGIAPVSVPAGFNAELRPYQHQGLAWLQFLREYELGGILADDMGLGKTVQALAHLLAEKLSGRLDRPALVIAPTSMMATWASEAARFAPALSLLMSHGMTRHQRGESFDQFDVVLTTYALLARDEKKLVAQQWHLVILDEAQNIKNPGTKAASIACHLQTRHRLCLTGTPMENHLGELWSLFRFLLPGLLGDEKTFQREYRKPIEKEGDLTRQRFLARRIHPFLLRRTKDLVASELPAKTLITRAIEFDSAQADLYETVRAAMDKRVREEIAAKGIGKSHIVVLDALLKLRQICCDPRLLKTSHRAKPPPSAKLVTLLEMLDELLAEGRSILLFSQFTSMLELIEAELKQRQIAYVKLTGATRDRKKPIERFQSGEVKLFLISLKAGGTGLTLTTADTVIHYDPWWNPAVENQATDRAHRIGQTKPVFVYKLIVKGSLEERIVEMQQKKGALASGLLDGDMKATTALDAADLQALFEPITS